MCDRIMFWRVKYLNLLYSDSSLLSLYCLVWKLAWYSVFMQGDRGLGLSAHSIDHCNLILKFPQGTNNTWVCLTAFFFWNFIGFEEIKLSHLFSIFQWQYNKQFKIFEPLEFKYNVCEALLLWEQTDENNIRPNITLAL